MKEQLLKDIKTGFDSLNEKLSEMLNLLTDEPKTQPPTIKTHLTREEAGFKMALSIRDFHIQPSSHRVIGIRLDGEVCHEFISSPSTVPMAIFYNTGRDKLPLCFRENGELKPSNWNNKDLANIGEYLVLMVNKPTDHNGNLIIVEYGG